MLSSITSAFKAVVHGAGGVFLDDPAPIREQGQERRQFQRQRQYSGSRSLRCSVLPWEPLRPIRSPTSKHADTCFAASRKAHRDSRLPTRTTNGSASTSTTD